ncbi:MAG: OsmC family protein [Candidatus Omnitrophica bacterium]|nr:OsmC family protein [Candidatus Omnitrophota bacterium]
MYKVDIENKGDYLFQVASENYTFFVDTNGSGVTPPDALLASLGTCVGVYIRKYAEGAKLNLPQFSIHVESDFTQDKPARFQDIKVIVSLNGALLDERRKQSVLEFVKNCPVHNTLKNNPLIEISIT